MALPVDSSLMLPPDQYLHTRAPKSGIALHHTVGGTAPSTLDWWRRDPNQVGTAYIIDRDGTLYQAFDPHDWAWQFGLKRPDWDRETKIHFEKRFIGIEIASAGGLLEKDGKLYCFDTISPRTRKDRSKAFDYGQDYRGYRYFDHYEEAQVDVLIQLINELCDTFAIPRKAPQDVLAYHGNALRDFEGIIGHTMVRLDKTDPNPDVAFWQRIIDACRLQSVAIGTAPAAEPATQKALTATEIEALFEANVQELNTMNVAAGSMVKGLIMELERGGRNTYLRLRDAVPGGHVIHYDFVQGAPDLVLRVAQALGFKEATASKLEVRHA